jgi:hypothetical protein
MNKMRERESRKKTSNEDVDICTEMNKNRKRRTRL